MGIFTWDVEAYSPFVVCISTLFLFLGWMIFILIPWLVNLPSCWWTFGLLLPFASVNSATLNENIRASICVEYLFEFFGYLPRVELLGHMATPCLTYWGPCQTVFHSSCAILHSHQQHEELQFFHMLKQHLLFSQVWWCYPVGVRMYLI